MARVTVEDCLENVDNIFKLVLVASRRARQIKQSGEHLGDSTATVEALRNIADGVTTPDILMQDEEHLRTEDHFHRTA
ncbi:MAG: DNA-directed RNA polymerase subunit omega [Gammaproteobacteria bacterium AqS3]|nr:DNA-directed RNA polymerase subunit omega [Gammaproteobacteria bacterium AqS3]